MAAVIVLPISLRRQGAQLHKTRGLILNLSPVLHFEVSSSALYVSLIGSVVSQDVRRGCSSKESASSSHDSPQPVDLFWVPDKRTLVEAIECVMSEQMPSVEGEDFQIEPPCARSKQH